MTMDWNYEQQIRWMAAIIAAGICASTEDDLSEASIPGEAVKMAIDIWEIARVAAEEQEEQAIDAAEEETSIS